MIKDISFPIFLYLYGFIRSTFYDVLTFSFIPVKLLLCIVSLMNEVVTCVLVLIKIDVSLLNPEKSQEAQNRLCFETLASKRNIHPSQNRKLIYFNEILCIRSLKTIKWVSCGNQKFYFENIFDNQKKASRRMKTNKSHLKNLLQIQI